MKDPYDFINWSPYSISQPIANSSYKPRLSRAREKYKRGRYGMSKQRVLFLCNLVTLLVLGILIITAIEQIFNG